MLPALLATVLFAVSTISGRRNVRLLGSAAANFWRQLFAVVVLAAYAHTLGQGWRGASLPWFLLSGFIGFGIGDVSIYLALPRIGARLTALITQCLAAPFGVLMAWAWHGTRPSIAEAIAGWLILAGVALALTPGRQDPSKPRPAALQWSGVVCGLLAALGQAGGQVVAKHGFQLAQAADTPADPLTVTYQRILPGVTVALIWFLLDHFGWRTSETPRPEYRRAWPWVLLNMLAGPTLGVACYQWATKVANTSLVLSVTAMTPLCVMALAYFLEGERPSRRGVIGGFIAVIGVVTLAHAA